MTITSRPTAADVARRAGVSTGTVSAVFNGKETVAAATRDQVLRAAEVVGYRPAYFVDPPGTASGRAAPSVAVIVRELDNPYYAEILQGARAALGARGVKMTALSSEGDFAEEGAVIRVARTHPVRGLIVAPVVRPDADLTHLFGLKRDRVPFVLLGEVHGLLAPTVRIDTALAAERAVAHLIELGHERIVHLSGPAYTQASRDRIVGLRQAFGSSPLVFTEAVVVEAGAHFEDGYRATLELLAARSGASRPTALFAFNDLVAMGALRALAEAGLDVPGDVSVVGFDDIPAAAYLSVPLTTVQVPAREMGARAAEILLDGPDREPPAGRPSSSPAHVVLDAPLVPRASTRPL